MKVLKLLFCAIIFVKSQMLVDIVYSSFTNSDFASNLTDFVQNRFQGKFKFKLININTINDAQTFISIPDIIFDITFSLSLSESIKQFAMEKHTIIASINEPHVFYSDWEFFIHNSWENKVEALDIIVSYLNWKIFIVISDKISNKDDQFFNYFYDKDCHWFFFSNGNDKASADLFIGRTIKSTGIKNLVILNQGESTKLLLESLEEHDLLNNGTGVIVGSEGSWNLYGDGVIAYIESGFESADCYYCYEGLAFIKFLELVLSFPSISNPLALLEYLNQKTVDHHPVSNFTLINIKNNQKSIQGNIFNGNLTILNPLVYPGNSLIIPNSPTTNINIWVADEPINPGSTSGQLAGSEIYHKNYALSYWKSIHALDGFEITATTTKCGLLVYNSDYAYDCFSKLLPNPGVGFITSFYPWITVGYIYTLRSLNFSIPIISPYAASNATKNSTNFPEFMTVTKDDAFNTQVILQFALIFGWKNFIVLYDEAHAAMYNYFAAKIKEFNMNIVNPPELRKIISNYTRDDYPKWKGWFKKLISLRGRLLIGFLTPSYGFYIAESLYDAGLRRGDSFFLSNSRVAYSIEWETDAVQRRKLIELTYGGIAVSQAEWIGNYGQMLKNGYIKQYNDNNTDFRCLPFDATMLLLHGIEFAIQKGQNVKNYEKMSTNLRKQKFTGCSGIVSIEPGSNQRSSPIIGIYNIKWDESSQKLYEDLVGVYDYSKVQLFTFNKAIIWYDNTTNVPTDIMDYENGCPFPARMIFRSTAGFNTLYELAAGLIVITFFESFWIWGKFLKQFRIKKLTESVHVHFEDYVLMGVLVIDFFQFISQGPDIIKLFPWLSLLCTYSMINFEDSIRGDKYWIYWYVAVGISCYWIFAAFVLFYRLNNLFSIILKHARNLSLLLLPIIAHIIFVPIISVLFSIFQCNEGIGDDITESFIKQDCTTYCWSHNYILWAMVSIISLISYIPLAIFLRYYYEIINSHINIRTNPIFNIEKSICQVIIVVMNKTIKNYSQFLHGICCIILFLLMILLCLKQKAYNYHRMNLWLIISYIAILWCFILSSIYWLINIDSIIWFALDYSAFVILIAAGIAIQCKWCPSLLYTDKAVDISYFFKFEFGRKISAADLNKMKSESRINETKCDIDSQVIVFTTRA